MNRPDGLGVVTMAVTADSVVRSCALATSIRIHEPGLPVVLLTTRNRPVPGGFFDEVARFDEPEPYLGRAHLLNKLVHPIDMSPFKRTFFLDDDTLVVRPFRDVISRHFVGRPLAISAQISKPADDHPGLNHLVPSATCDELRLESCLNTYGGGHMYFEERSAARELADAAVAEVLGDPSRYRRLAGSDVISDELGILIMANRRSLGQPVVSDFVDAIRLQDSYGVRLDIAKSIYEWRSRPWGSRIEDVCIVHFCTDGKRSLPYARAVHSLTGFRQSFDEGARGVARRWRQWARSSPANNARRA
jgi:hypothetical protein